MAGVVSEQRHPVWPSHVAHAPGDWPEPVGDVTTWALRTPEGEPVGVLAFNEGGLSWTFASTEDASAQVHGAEVQALLRGALAQGVPLADVVEAVGAAYGLP